MNVFVYGTLMFPEVARPIAGIVQEGEDAVLYGYRRFKVRKRGLGNFPAIVPVEPSDPASQAAAVRGLLFSNVDVLTLKRLDWFEEVDAGAYTREIVTVACGQRSVSAYAYVCGETLRKRLDGPWDPVAFRREELAWYLGNVVKECVASDWYAENVLQR